MSTVAVAAENPTRKSFREVWLVTAGHMMTTVSRHVLPAAALDRKGTRAELQPDRVDADLPRSHRSSLERAPERLAEFRKPNAYLENVVVFKAGDGLTLSLTDLAARPARSASP
jgi:hypothetical protein